MVTIKEIAKRAGVSVDTVDRVVHERGRVSNDTNTFDYKFVKQIPKNLPYVFFNSSIPDSNNITYIGQDSYQSGMLAGNLMLMTTQQPGSLVVLTMLHDDYHIGKRQQGFEDYVKQNTNMSIKVYGARRAEDRETFEHVLELIFSENDDLLDIVTQANIDYY